MASTCPPPEPSTCLEVTTSKKGCFFLYVVCKFTCVNACNSYNILIHDMIFSNMRLA